MSILYFKEAGACYLKPRFFEMWLDYPARIDDYSSDSGAAIRGRHLGTPKHRAATLNAMTLPSFQRWVQVWRLIGCEPALVDARFLYGLRLA